MSEHTRGPWNVQFVDERRFNSFTGEPVKSDLTILIHGHNSAFVGVVSSGSLLCKANAHLIAAAPELLDALKQARQMIRNESLAEAQPAYIGMIDRLDAAIAKAEGRS